MMARVTVEDCIDKVENRFELVLIAAQRAKDINSGAPLTKDRGNDKDPVIALKEIALGHISTEVLREEIIKSLQLNNKVDVIDDDSHQFDNEGDGEKFDYLPEGSDIYISDDHSDLDEDAFGQDDIDESDDKGFSR